jgi:TolB protein
VSTRDDSTADPAVDLQRAFLAFEIYLVDGDGTNPRRLTRNAWFDGFPTLSPDGSRIVFESNRLRAASEPFNVSDLFLMNTDGTGQTFLIRGSSATWSPDGKHIAFHASVSGKGQPISTNPGAATSDNDIFVASLDELIEKRAKPRNLTTSPGVIDEDPDWSPDGQTIVYTAHAAANDPANTAGAEIYVLPADGKGAPRRLTNNTDEERGPAWSPDGKRILFSCRKGGPDFEVCVINADGTGLVQLTDNSVPDLTASWSPDGSKIAFHRRMGGRGAFQLFSINADGTGEVQLTFARGLNGYAHWGQVRAR